MSKHKRRNQEFLPSVPNGPKPEHSLKSAWALVAFEPLGGKLITDVQGDVRSAEYAQLRRVFIPASENVCTTDEIGAPLDAFAISLI